MPSELCALLLSGLLATGSVNPPPEPADKVHCANNGAWMEMLEFLGAFETQGGKWLDPLSLDDRVPEKLQPARVEKQHEHE
jgi:hypothetical protein